MTRHTTTIKVDPEVYNAIRKLKTGPSDTFGNALRRFLGLDLQRLTDNIKCLKRMETRLRAQRRQERRVARKK